MMGVPSVQGWGTPQPDYNEGYPMMGVHTPPPVQGSGTPGIGQRMEYLIRRGWCASCIHAGGFSCHLQICSSCGLELYIITKNC